MTFPSTEGGWRRCFETFPSTGGGWRRCFETFPSTEGGWRRCFETFPSTGGGWRRCFETFPSTEGGWRRCFETFPSTEGRWRKCIRTFLRPVGLFILSFSFFTSPHYFPMQNLEKMLASTSSVTISPPVISPSAWRQSRRSSASRSPGKPSLSPASTRRMASPARQSAS